MRPILPRPFGQKLPLIAGLLLSCHREAPPTTLPEPIPAEREIALEPAETECARFVARLEQYGACTHASEAERTWAKRVIESFATSFQASRKAEPDPEADRVIAGACYRAAQSVAAATARCAAGSASPSNDDAVR